MRLLVSRNCSIRSAYGFKLYFQTYPSPNMTIQYLEVGRLKLANSHAAADESAPVRSSKRPRLVTVTSPRAVLRRAWATSWTRASGPAVVHGGLRADIPLTSSDRGFKRRRIQLIPTPNLGCVHKLVDLPPISYRFIMTWWWAIKFSDILKGVLLHVWTNGWFFEQEHHAVQIIQNSSRT